jgi:hypothetical protein
MGIRGELFSTRVSCNGRTYFFNVKENRMGDMFLTVVESKPSETEGFERRSVVVFREDMTEFVKAFQGALSYMEKPERGSKSLDFSPAPEAAARRGRTPGGFAGSEPPEKPKKRRVVVRRKPTTPDGSA